MMNQRALDYLGKTLLILGFGLIGVSILTGYCYLPQVSVWSEAMGFALICGGYIALFLAKRKFASHTTIQCFAISVIFSIIFFSALICPDTVKTSKKLILLFTCTTVINLLFWAVQLVSSCREKIQSERFGIDTIKDYLKGKKWLLCVILLSFLLCIDTFDWFPMWDSKIYFDRIREAATTWDFSFQSIGQFNYAGHMSIGYSMLISIGVWLFRDPVFGTHFMQSVLTIGMGGAFYGILSRLMPKMKEMEKALFTMMCMLYPAILGMVQNFNVDYPTMLFFVIMLYFYYSGYSILQVFFGILMCFTKEPAIVMYAGFAIGVYLYNLWEKKVKNVIHIFKCLRIKDFFALVIPAVCWLAVFISLRFNSQGPQGWTKFAVGKENSTSHSFDYAPDYIWFQLRQFFTMNYIWLFLALVFVFSIYLLMNQKSRAKNDVEISLVLPVLIGVICFIIFNCVYHTVAHYRYKAPVYPAFFIMGIVVIWICVKSGIIRKVIAISFCIIFFLQTFSNIDPALRINGFVRDVGKGDILCIGSLLRISDHIVYNRQSMDWEKAIQNALDRIDYGDDTIILFPEIASENLFYGLYNNTFWDKDTGRITLNLDGEDLPELHFGYLCADGTFMDTPDGYQRYDMELSNYSKAYYFDLEYFDDFIGEEVLGQTGVSYSYIDTVGAGVWEIKIVEIDK